MDFKVVKWPTIIHKMQLDRLSGRLNAGYMLLNKIETQGLPYSMQITQSVILICSDKCIVMWRYLTPLGTMLLNFCKKLPDYRTRLKERLCSIALDLKFPPDGRQGGLNDNSK